MQSSRCARWLFVAVAITSTRAAAQAAPRPEYIGTWRDPAPHRSGSVSVARGVRIHYLDWGGKGPALIMLAGVGNTAHAWDTFAPRFTDRWHVVAITRRGFGESSHLDGGYDIPTRVEDIRKVLDALGLDRVVLIGHSIAGEELTRFALAYPKRTVKLVYLDAAYDRPAVDSIAQETLVGPFDLPARPDLTAADTATPEAYVASVHRTRGVRIPEADIRARLFYDGAEESLTSSYQQVASAVEHPRWSSVRAPALAVYAVTDSVKQDEPWIRADTSRRDNRQQFLDQLEPVMKYSRDEFRHRMPKGRVLEVHGGHHWVFLSHMDEVATAIKSFLADP